jgi:RNA-directed DNA polymerase
VLGNDDSVETKLRRIAEKAGSDPNVRFTSLFHLMTEELLPGCFERLRNNAASGIDGVTKEQYAENLERNLRELVGKLHGMAYIPQPVERVYIPKPGSDKKRPLGIPAGHPRIGRQAGTGRIGENPASDLRAGLHRRLVRIPTGAKLS